MIVSTSRRNRRVEQNALKEGAYTFTPKMPKAPNVRLQVKSVRAIRDIEKYTSKIEGHLKIMRKLCPLSDVDRHFEEFQSHQNKMKYFLDQSNKVLRKMEKPFYDTTYIDPIYETSSSLRDIHNQFQMTLNDLKITRQRIFSGHLFYLAGQLTTQFNTFVSKNNKNPQFNIIFRDFEAEFQSLLEKAEKKLTDLLAPIYFDSIDVRDVILLMEDYKTLNRMFETEMAIVMKPMELYMPRPDPRDTKWHKVFIEFVPLLSHVPLFNEQIRYVDECIPPLTEGISFLCDEIDKAAPIHQELSVFNDKITDFNIDEVDSLIIKASTFLEITHDPSLTKVNQLESIMEKVELTILQLRKELKESQEMVEKLQKDNSKIMIQERLKSSRANVDSITEKYKKEKDDFLNTALLRMRDLVERDISDHNTDPYHQFNAMYFQISREMNQLRQKNYELQRPVDVNMKSKFSKILNIIAPEVDEKKMSIDEITDFIVERLQNNQVQNTRKFLIDLNKSFTGKEGSELSNSQLIENIDNMQKDLRNSLIAVCTKNSSRNKSDFEDKNLLELVDLAKKVPVFPINEYTKSTIEPITKLISEMNISIDRKSNAYVPSSPQFPHFLEIINNMKETLYRTNPDDVIHPVHALLNQAVELYNKLSITLSSSSFAPEFEKNEEIVSDLLTKYQSANQSLIKLRILLEEKEKLLEDETTKLIECEEKAVEQYSSSGSVF